MKIRNITYISAFCVALAIGTTSCKNEEKDIFDHSAAERLDAAKKEYCELLTSNGGKWEMEYFANDKEEGYNYIITFQKDGSVEIAGNNKYINYQYTGEYDKPLYKSETSLWDVILDSGPVLSFSSFNPTFHIFAAPDDIPGTKDPDSGNDIDETGYGHEGDYEFKFLESEDSNNIRLKGKKSGIYIYLRRIDANTDAEAYLKEIEAKKNSSFSTKLDSLILTDAKGERFVMTGGSTRIFSIFPETGDKITQTSTGNAIITKTGIRFMNPVYVDCANGVDSVAFNEFKFIEDGSLVSVDDEKVTIKSQDKNTLLSAKDKTWAIDITSLKGDIKTAYDDAASKLANFQKTTITAMQIGYDKVAKKNSLILKVRSKLGTKWQNLVLNYYFTPEKEGFDVLKPVLESKDEFAISYETAVPEIKTLVAKILNQSLTLSSESALLPLNMTVVDKTNNNEFKVALQ